MIINKISKLNISKPSVQEEYYQATKDGLKISYRPWQQAKMPIRKLIITIVTVTVTVIITIAITIAITVIN